MQAASPERTDPALAADLAPEVVAQRAPRLNIFSTDVPLAGAVQTRERFVARALTEFRAAFRTDVAVAIGYVALPIAGGLIDRMRGGTADAFAPGLTAGILWLLLASAGYVLHRSQFRAVESRSVLERGLFGLLNVVFVVITIASVVLRGMNPTVLKWAAEQVLRPAMRVLVACGYVAIVAVMALSIGGWTGAGLGLAALLHVYLLVQFVYRVRDRPGVRLLVLRVFGFDASAQFTFDGVLRFWSHFGHFFTIVDSTYWRHRNRLRSWRTLGDALVATVCVLGAVLLALGSVSLVHLNENIAPVAALAFAIAALAAYTRFSDRRMKASFVQNHDQLSQLLTQLDAHPRSIGLGYKSLEIRCHLDTWRMAVAGFADTADAVLMDLRGYSDARKGCQFEVNFLLDTVPLERVVFLVDAALDGQVLTQLILSAWRDLRSTSPNLNNATPQVQIYKASARDEPDIQGILDLLIHASALHRQPICPWTAVGPLNSTTSTSPSDRASSRATEPKRDSLVEAHVCERRS